MKKIIILALIVTLIHCKSDSYEKLPSYQPPSLCVWLFKKVNYRGIKDEFCYPKQIMNVIQEFGQSSENQYSSIKIGVHVYVKAFKNFNLKGSKKEYHGNHATLAGWNNKISSMKAYIKPQFKSDYSITLFMHPKYDGNSQSYLLGCNRNVEKKYNDKFSSMKVGKFVLASLYKHNNYVHRVLDRQKKNISDFSQKGINDMISSVKVYLREDYIWDE